MATRFILVDPSNNWTDIGHEPRVLRDAIATRDALNAADSSRRLMLNVHVEAEMPDPMRWRIIAKQHTTTLRLNDGPLGTDYAEVAFRYWQRHLYFVVPVQLQP